MLLQDGFFHYCASIVGGSYIALPDLVAESSRLADCAARDAVAFHRFKHARAWEGCWDAMENRTAKRTPASSLRNA